MSNRVSTYPYGIHVYYDEHINGNRHDAVLHATTTWISLCSNGFADPRFVGFDLSDSVIYSMKENDLVSLIVFSVDEVSKVATIKLGGTRFEYRKKGHYKKLMVCFEIHIRSKGIRYIETIVSPENINMQNINSTRKPVGMFMRKTL